MILFFRFFILFTMDLVIVESPTKSRTLTRFLGKNLEILATMGHIRDLPRKKLGVDVKSGFKPQYVQVPGKKETIKDKVFHKVRVGRFTREDEALSYGEKHLRGKGIAFRVVRE